MKLKALLLGVGMMMVSMSEADPGMPQGLRPEMIEKMGLDQETAKAIKVKLKAVKESSEDLREQIKESRGKIRELMQDMSTTEAQIRSAAQESARLLEDMLASMIRTRNEVDAMLNPEQREKFRQAMQRLQRREGRRGEFRERAGDSSRREALRERLRQSRGNRHWDDEDDDDFDDLDD